MKKILFVAFLLCYCGLYSDVSAEFDNSAYVTYEALLSEKTTGTYSEDGFVFFIVNIEISGRRVNRNIYEGRAMLRVKDLVKKFFTGGITVNTSGIENYKGPIRDKIDGLLSSNNVHDFNMNNLRGRILVNQAVKKNGKRYYRYVFSVADDVAKKKKKELSSVEIDIAYLVRKTFQEALVKDQYQELVSYYLEMGLWEDAIYFQRKILSKKFNLVNYYHSIDPMTERKCLRMLLEDTTHITEPASILKKLPGNIDALNSIINKTDDPHPLKKVVLQLAKLPAVSKKDLDRNYNKLNKLIAIIGNGAGLSEYLQVVKGIQQRVKTHCFTSDIIIQNSFLALGHLNMDETLKKSENNFFQSAIQHFKKGGDKNMIRRLLVQSIRESPRHAESWNYLGAIMTAENLSYEAVVLHTQAYYLDNNNLETMANLADCYLRLGKKNLALNYATYLEILNYKVKSKFVSKVILKIKREN
ncbi:hypothetical protein KAI46_09630 [bacterium]|nr:hypothetical protein [bacterium]